MASKIRGCQSEESGSSQSAAKAQQASKILQPDELVKRGYGHSKVVERVSRLQKALTPPTEGETSHLRLGW